jgi:hypothetical protein
VKDALAFVHIHRPHIDLKVIGRGPPPAPGGGDVQMKAHYEAVDGLVANIIRLVEAETNDILRQ